MIFGWELLLWRRPWETLPISWIFFSLKWIWFLSPWEDRVKCSLVILWCTPRDTFWDAQSWEIPKHHFIHQQRWNSTGRKKIKISLDLPPSATEFYPLNFNFTSGIPWEIPGGSLQQGWLGQHSHGEPKPEVNPKGWGAGSALAKLPRYLNRSLSTSAKVPPRGLQNALPKTLPAPATAAHLALPRKKGNKIGNQS